ncbi:MAG: helix-turn-helix transcriptional regulator [Cyanobacteria bacterium P01_D01_bin.156]
MNSSFSSQSLAHESMLSSLLKAALDNLVDGLLIVAASGRVLQANTTAARVCDSLTVSDVFLPEISKIPAVLWRLCSPIFKKISDGIEAHLEGEFDITNVNHQPIRVRIQPLNLKIQEEDCLMLILEDRYQAYRRRAIADGQRYGLTPREVDVWVLRLQEQSYEAIAGTLFITENTVKKHVKSILAKRRISGDEGYGEILPMALALLQPKISVCRNSC